jgi:hypothetical protein
VILYHRTTVECAARILVEGFRDGCGTTEDREYGDVGVWLSDHPFPRCGWVSGDVILRVDLNLDEEVLAPHEQTWGYDGCRIWLIPAALIDMSGEVTIHFEGDWDDYDRSN